jgi:hypothetical protein
MAKEIRMDVASGGILAADTIFPNFHTMRFWLKGMKAGQW